MIKKTITLIAAMTWIAGGAQGLTLTEGAQWSSFPVAVCFEQPRAEHKQDRQQIRRMVEQSWAKQSAVSFKGWGPCHEGSKGIRILLSDGYPKTQTRGRFIDGIRNGMQLPKLWGLASLSVNAKTTVHEFGHALGFGHEYARPDAPFDDECSIKGADGQRYLEDDQPITGFDFNSIMVGCVKGATLAFSTGVPKLSAADIYGLVAVYGSAEHNILDADESGDLFGQSLAVGDFDGDDVPDLAVGAPGEGLADPGKRQGAVYLYKGDDVRGLRPWGRLTSDGVIGFGSALRVGQIDQDKRDDLIVSTADGAVSVFTGRSRKLPKLSASAHPALAIAATPALVVDVEPFDIDLANEDTGFGHASVQVDLDLDGHLDLIATAPRAEINGVASGQVFVYRSPSTDFPWKQRPATFVPWYRFGQSY